LDEWLRSKFGRAADAMTLLRHLSGAARGLSHLHAEGLIALWFAALCCCEASDDDRFHSS
jgi:hypothetical protein